MDQRIPTLRSAHPLTGLAHHLPVRSTTPRRERDRCRMDSTETSVRGRVRAVDWRRVINELEQLPDDATVFVGVLDQSVRTHFNQGRYSYIDPSKYVAFTESHDGSRTQARIYVTRRRDAGTH